MTTITSNNANYTNFNDYQAGNYEVANDCWGSGAESGITDWLTLNPATFPGGVTFDWNWPTVSASTWSPQAYPDMIYVHQWANGNGGGTGALYSNEVPDTLSNISTLTASYNVSLAGNTASTDVAFDIWLTSPGNHNLNWTTVGPETELMIFVHSPTAFGSGSGNFTAGGITNGSLSVGTQSNGSVNWQFVSVQAPQDMLSGTININAIFQTLVADGVLNANEQVSDIRFGSEVSGGAGSLTINSFNVNWQDGTTPPPPPPPTPTVSPSGTVVPNNSGGTITDSSLNLWTVTNGVVDENAHAAGYSANVTEIAYVTGLVYQENSSGHWWDWTGSTWASTSNPFHHH